MVGLFGFGINHLMVFNKGLGASTCTTAKFGLYDVFAHSNHRACNGSGFTFRISILQAKVAQVPRKGNIRINIIVRNRVKVFVAKYELRFDINFFLFGV